MRPPPALFRPRGALRKGHGTLSHSSHIVVLRVAARSGIDTCRIVQAKDRGGRFPAGKPGRHHLINRTDRVAVYLEGGDRLPGDRAYYPDVDLEARATCDGYSFFHKDGTRYEAVTG